MRPAFRDSRPRIAHFARLSRFVCRECLLSSESSFDTEGVQRAGDSRARRMRILHRRSDTFPLLGQTPIATDPFRVSIDHSPIVLSHPAAPTRRSGHGQDVMEPASPDIRRNIPTLDIGGVDDRDNRGPAVEALSSAAGLLTFRRSTWGRFGLTKLSAMRDAGV